MSRRFGLVAFLLLFTAGLVPAPGAAGDAVARPSRHGRFAGGAPEELVVRLPEGRDVESLRRLVGGLRSRSGRTRDLYRITLRPGSRARMLARQLKRYAGIEEAEPAIRTEISEGLQSTVPALGEDPYDKGAFQGQPAFQTINRTGAARYATGKGVVVAVIDTGVRATHECLIGRLTSTQYDFVGGDTVPDEEQNRFDDDGDGLVDEGLGHGTFAAGLIAALAPDASIMPLRALDDEGLGTSFALADAIGFATAHGADVINVSVGLVEASDVVAGAVYQAIQEGVVVVAAAGNSGTEFLSSPANLPGVIAVTSVDGSDRKAGFASYHRRVSFCAPGVSVIGPWVGDGDDVYARWSGTSFSTAMVSAAAALVLQRSPTFSPKRVKRAIASGAVPVNALNPDYRRRLGRGRLDLLEIFR